MNKLTIIGNLTKDPETRTTTSGLTVCNFTVAVNRKKKTEGQPEADFFQVAAWRQLGENCGKFLAKGRKVAVVGPVSVRTYESKGKTYASLEVVAEDVEFLGGKESQGDEPEPVKDPESGYSVVDTDELPF